jgi:hypothetical protein
MGVSNRNGRDRSGHHEIVLLAKFRALHIGNIVSSASQSEVLSLPQAMKPFSAGRVTAAGAAFVSCAGWAPAAVVRVWTVRATATVAIKAAAMAAAETNFVVRVIMVGLTCFRH